MSQAQQTQRVDFLRHIVNRVLAEHSLPRQVVEDVRKSIGYAEEKYKFSAFGGDPRRLADYLRSRDFDDVVTLLRGAKAEEVLVKILEEVKKRYSEYREVVEAAEARLKELRGETVEEPKTKIGLAYNALRNLEEKGVEVKLDEATGRVEARYGAAPCAEVTEIELKGEKVKIARPTGTSCLEIHVTYDKAKKVYNMEFVLSGKISAETTSKLYDIALKLVELAKSIIRG